MNLIKQILELPGSINYEGIDFEFMIFINGSEELRIAYDISHVSQSSPHFIEYVHSRTWTNPFYGDGFKGFLYLHEDISDEKSLIDALKDCKEFLIKNKLHDF